MAQGCSILTRHRNNKIKVLGHGLEKVKQANPMNQQSTIYSKYSGKDKKRTYLWQNWYASSD